MIVLTARCATSKVSMAEFDVEAARRRHDSILSDVRRLRDGINADVIDFYKNEVPNSEEAQRRAIDGMRKYLDLASKRIDDLFKGELRR